MMILVAAWLAAAPVPPAITDDVTEAEGGTVVDVLTTPSPYQPLVELRLEQRIFEGFFLAGSGRASLVLDSLPIAGGGVIQQIRSATIAQVGARGVVARADAFALYLGALVGIEGAWLADSTYTTPLLAGVGSGFFGADIPLAPGIAARVEVDVVSVHVSASSTLDLLDRGRVGVAFAL